PPPDRLRAEERRPPLLRRPQEALQPRAELLRLHVVGVPAEGGVPPDGVHRLRGRPAPPPQLREVHVVEPRDAQRGGEGLGVEVRVRAGAREAAHVRDALHLVRLQQAQELLQRARGVPDRPDRERERGGHGGGTGSPFSARISSRRIVSPPWRRRYSAPPWL